MTTQPDNLLLVWTTADREVASDMMFMYGFNAKKHGWWGHVQVLIWGPSGKTLLADEKLQAELKKMMSEGIDVTACKACADRYDIADDLAALGINVIYTGQLLTERTKDAGWRVLTV